MAIRRSREETLVVAGDREVWAARSQKALEAAGFKKIVVDEELGQIEAAYRKLTVWGRLEITLRPAGPGETELHLRSTANVDNVYALFKSPTKHIADVFKSEISST